MKHFFSIFIVTVNTFLYSSTCYGSPGFVYGISYYAEIEGNKVIICIGQFPRELEFLACPNRKDLLRQNVKSKEVVVFTSPVCDENKAERSAICYVDECVPPGTYQYGLAYPLSCSISDNVEYYKEVEVTQQLSPTCMRSQGSLPPTPTSWLPPWLDNPKIHCPHCGCNATVAPHPSEFPWIPVLLTLILLFATIRRKPS